MQYGTCILTLLLTGALNANAQTSTTQGSMLMTVKGNDTVYAEMPNVANARYIGKMPDPEFPGDMNEFFRRNIRIPDKQSLHYGNVVLYCRVTETGAVTMPVILNTADTSFNVEALRLIQIMPKWKPALLDGKPIWRDIHITIPFAYR